MSLGIGTLQQTKNTADLIADALRAAILQGKLSSGQWLKQDEIAAEFGVSKIPVREALVQLQAEGLIRLVPSRGAMVSELTFGDIVEIYAIRGALEPIALAKAMPRLTSTDYLRMHRILDQIDLAEDMTLWAELNWSFHEAMYLPANMPRLLNTVYTMYNNVARYLLSNHLDMQYLAVSQAQHRGILKACQDGNKEQAVERLLEHLGDPVKEYGDMIDKQ